jgi:hypothetical protein
MKLNTVENFAMPNPINTNILDLLRTKGPHLDSAIAEALKEPLAKIRAQVAELSSTGDLICCNTIQFVNGEAIEGLSCRVSCYIPPAARGRKPGQKSASANAHKEVPLD